MVVTLVMVLAIVVVIVGMVAVLGVNAGHHRDGGGGCAIDAGVVIVAIAVAALS